MNHKREEPAQTPDNAFPPQSRGRSSPPCPGRDDPKLTGRLESATFPGMVAVLLAVAVLVVVGLAFRVGRVAGGSALLPAGMSVAVVGSGLHVPMCGGARRRLALFAGSP